MKRSLILFLFLIFTSTSSNAFWSQYYYRHHKLITEKEIRDVQHNFGNEIIKFDDASINKITNFNREMDEGSFENKRDIHFDNENFKNSHELIIRARKEIIEYMSGKDPWRYRGKSLRLIGSSLHTLQDFYSHSTWVELGNNRVVDMTSGNASTLFNGEERGAVCYYEEPYNIIPNSILTTGYYGEIPDKIYSKCNHGSVLETFKYCRRGKDNDSLAKPGINKDDIFCGHLIKQEPDNLLAANLAAEETKLFIDSIILSLNAEEKYQGICALMLSDKDDCPNTPPYYVGGLDDVMLNVGITKQISTVAAFNDAEDKTSDLAVNVGVVSGNDVITAVMNVAGTGIDITALKAGEATVRVTVTDRGGLSASTTFKVVVTASNTPPRVVGSIPEVTLEKGEKGTIVSAFGVFEDKEDGGLFDLTLSAKVIAGAGVIRLGTVNGLAIPVDPLEVGEATVQITATDRGGLSASTTFKVVVTASNTPPRVVGSIPEITLKKEGAGTEVSAFGVFEDKEDSGLFDLTLSAEVIAGAGVIRLGTVSGVGIPVDPLEVGEATVQITATDSGGLSASTTFKVVVAASNTPPRVVGSIPEITLIKGGAGTEVSALGVFEDKEDSGLFDLTLSAKVIAGAGVISLGTVNGLAIPVDPLEVGEATVQITATDSGGLSASTTFKVVVTLAPLTEVTVTFIPIGNKEPISICISRETMKNSICSVSVGGSKALNEGEKYTISLIPGDYYVTGTFSVQDEHYYFPKKGNEYYSIPFSASSNSDNLIELNYQRITAEFVLIDVTGLPDSVNKEKIVLSVCGTVGESRAMPEYGKPEFLSCGGGVTLYPLNKLMKPYSPESELVLDFQPVDIPLDEICNPRFDTRLKAVYDVKGKILKFQPGESARLSFNFEKKGEVCR